VAAVIGAAAGGGVSPERHYGRAAGQERAKNLLRAAGRLADYADRAGLALDTMTPPNPFRKNTRP